MTEPRWVTEQDARYIYSELMAEHGGLQGNPRAGALESALAHPRNTFAYASRRPTLERLAAAYGHALVRGHCYPDGNKRLGLAVMDVFLQLNGRELTAREEDAVLVMRDVAAGKLSEEGLADWVRLNSALVKQ